MNEGLQLRSMVTMLFPDEITPTAKQMLDGLADAWDARIEHGEDAA